jgi:type IV secretion system protein VirB10
VTREAAEAGNPQNVRGERSVAAVNVARSVQSRVSSALAAALMIALGVVALTWYYAHALTRPARARALTQSTTTNRAQGEMALPSLGRITPPPVARDPPPIQEVPQPPVPLAAVPLSEAQTTSGTWAAPAAAGTADAVHPGAPAPKTVAELARERRLSGGVFARVSTAAAAPSPPANGSLGITVGGESEGGAANARPAADASEGALQALLKPVAAAAVQARLLPTTRFLLPKGAFIDCTLETAIDSTLPGMTTCVTAADAFGADGKVVLLERGSKLVGETRGQVQQGQARVFVVWTEARTPTGVIVPLDSPGTDELGRAGLPGDVDRHFWERFGAAMLITVINGAVQAGVQAANKSGGAVIYAPTTSQDVMTEVLKSTINIAPTVIKHNGDRIQVLVARDLDFRSVYELRAPATGR